MRLLVTVTVLYLVTSSVYSWAPPGWGWGPDIITIPTPKGCTPCVQSQCDTQVLCKGGKVKDRCGCCNVCAKVKGEKCEWHWHSAEECDHGLECDDGICSTICKAQYFWVERFGLKLGQMGLILDKLMGFF